MTKLETLEDLDIFKTYKKLLRQVAIKWVRFYRKRMNGRQLGNSIRNEFAFAKQDFIMDFFNITEDDLK